MKFSHKNRTLRIGNTYDLHAFPEMSAHVEKMTVEAEVKTTGRKDEASTWFYPDLMILSRKEPKQTLNRFVFWSLP